MLKSTLFCKDLWVCNTLRSCIDLRFVLYGILIIFSIAILIVLIECIDICKRLLLRQVTMVESTHINWFLTLGQTNLLYISIAEFISFTFRWGLESTLTALLLCGHFVIKFHQFVDVLWFDAVCFLLNIWIVVLSDENWLESTILK